MEFIIGRSSIEMALNSSRKKYKLIVTNESIKQFKKVDVPIETVKSVQEYGEALFSKNKLAFSRIPGNAILIAEDTPIYSLKDIDKVTTKIVALDGVTDISNAAAIMRTAAFFGVEYLIIERKHSFSITPSFSRISSGALELVKIVQVANLSKAITSLNEMNFITIGLMEDGDDFKKPTEKRLCLVMGAEDNGISFAVSRVLKEKFALKGKGALTTLNVAVASGLAMNKAF